MGDPNVETIAAEVMRGEALLFFRFSFFGLMNTDSPCFDDPELLVHWLGFEGVQELTNQLFEQRQGGIMGNSDNNNTVGLLGREPQYVGKIQVKGYQTALLCTTDFV